MEKNGALTEISYRGGASGTVPALCQGLTLLCINVQLKRTIVALLFIAIMIGVVLSDHVVIILVVAAFQVLFVPLHTAHEQSDRIFNASTLSSSILAPARWQTMVFDELVKVRQDVRLENRKIPMFRTLNWCVSWSCCCWYAEVC